MDGAFELVDNVLGAARTMMETALGFLHFET
jgi:hypothetical protein